MSDSLVANVQLLNHLKTHPLWVEMVEVLEEQWGVELRQLVSQLKLSRDLYKFTKSDASLMRNFSEFDLSDRETLQRVCNLLGFTYPNVDNLLFTTEDYLRIAQNVSAYYQEQGTESFLAFFSYCLNFNFTLKPQWTQDYINFFDEGDPTIGVPVWNGGSWYPTSHVVFETEVGRVPPDRFEEFFKYIAPINLVLMATRFTDSSTFTRGIVPYGQMHVIISN